MAHPFQDKLICFIGIPIRCTQQVARDALIAVGGVIDENISAFVNYAVAFTDAKKTKNYSMALKYKSFLSILDENQFFDILEGRAAPPKLPESNRDVTCPSSDSETAARESKLFLDDLIIRKRLDNLAQHGIISPDGGRIKIDFRSLDNVRRLVEFMKQKHAAAILDTPNVSERCDYCYNPVSVHLGDGEGGQIAGLCQNCYNQLMAEMTGADISSVMPKRLSFKGRGGKTYEFDVDLMIFPNGMLLTASEIGKTKRKVDVHGELDADMNKMLEALRQRIMKAIAVKYMKPDGYIAKNKAVGYIEYNSERDAHDIIIDGKPYTWADLEKNISVHEGWKFKIEFGSVGDDIDDDY